MILKVIRDLFLNHKGERFEKDDVFEIEDNNYNLRTFYERRKLDGDVVEITKKQPKEAKKSLIINKTEGK